MLSCRQFVERATNAEEFESASFGNKLNIRFHRFICHHCKTFNKQFRMTTVVAKNLTPEDISETIIDNAVDDMKNYSPGFRTPVHGNYRGYDIYSMSPRIHHQWLPDQLRVEEGLSPDTIKRLQDSKIP